MSNLTKSIFDLGIDDLEKILESNQLPPGITLEGIETRKDFDKLFKHRATPKYIAQAILKEKLKAQINIEPGEIKSQRLQVKQMELEIRKKRAENTSYQQEQIYKKLQALEQGMNMIIRSQAELNRLMSDLIERNAI